MDLIRTNKYILNFNELKDISLKSSLISLDGPYLLQRGPENKQILKPSDSFERALYKKSKYLFRFKETVIIRAKTKQGLSIDSKLLKGEFSSFSNLKKLEEEISKLDFRVRQKSFDLCHYEIIHTHPTGCYLEDEGEYQVISLGGLSSSDYEVANYLEQKYSFSFRLKAICPGGITYCSV